MQQKVDPQELFVISPLRLDGGSLPIMRTLFITLTTICCIATTAVNDTFAQTAPVIEGYEAAPTSPKEPWGEFKPVQENEGTPWWSHVLLWIPNRVLDLIDVFRVDAGVGPAFGGVVRVTKYAQAGYRQMLPVSLRVGDFGRQMPIVVEASNEIGVSPLFIESKDRNTCPGEFGLGADLFVVGAYGGVCVDEAVDFLAGIFFIDLKDDDM